MLGKKAYYGICICRDCGGINDIVGFRRIQKRRERQRWKREVSFLQQHKNTSGFD